MNGLEEIQGNIKNFIAEKQQVKKQISEIEQKRTELAQKRNEMKKFYKKCLYKKICYVTM